MTALEGGARIKWRGLLSLPFLLVVLGCVLYAVGSHVHDRGLSEPGLLLALVGAFLPVRRSSSHARPAPPTGETQAAGPEAARRFNDFAWPLIFAVMALWVALPFVLPGLLNHGWAVDAYGLLGAAAVVAVSLLVRARTRRAPPADGSPSGRGGSKTIRRFDRAMRIIGVALVPLVAVSAVAFFSTPVTSREVWPLYTFLVVGLAGVLVWAYLFGRLLVKLAVGGR